MSATNYSSYVNPDYVKLLSSLGFYRNFKQAYGCILTDDVGIEYLDFLSGYGVHNIGHNHPILTEMLANLVQQKKPSFLNIDASDDQAELAYKLTTSSGMPLTKTLFCNCGGESVDMTIRLARAATGRSLIVSCHKAYHGLTCGALSLMSEENHRSHFGSLLSDVVHIPFNDLSALDAVMKTSSPALFIVEPIQGEGGVNLPSENYLRDAAALCRKHNVLFALDEIQSGLGRTGSLFAADHYNVSPDILLIGKALSGGLLPIVALMMQEHVYKKGVAGMERCFMYHSTFAGGLLAVVTARKTLEIIENEGLSQKAQERGEYLLKKLKLLASKYKIIKEVRGKGLLVGLEFHKPETVLYKTVPKGLRDCLFAYAVASVLLNRFNIIVQPCSISGNTLKVEPPLTISNEQIDKFVEAFDLTLEQYPTHSKALIGVAKFSIFGY